MRFLLMSCIAFLGVIVIADENHPPGHPCHKIQEACKAAGFVWGGHKNNPPNGIGVECMKPLMNGESVKGVSVDAADVSACKAKKGEKHHGKH